MIAQTIKEKISYAVNMTPSGDNCQPFSGLWSGEEIIIHHDDEIARHKLNHKNYASMLALGCLLENVRVAALHGGLLPHYQLDPSNPLADFRITFTPAPSADDRLLSTLGERCTDRRNFLKGWNPQFDQEFSEIAKDYPSTLKTVEKLPQKVRKLFLDGDKVMWVDQEVFFNIFSWVRFSEEEARKTKDGMPSANLGLNLVTAPLMWVASRGKAFQSLFRWTGSPIAGRHLMAQQLDTSGGFTFFYPSAHDLIGIVEAGRLGQRIWLELTLKGYAVQPVTMGTLMTYVAQYLELPPFPDKVKALLRDGAKTMEQELALPVWGLRWGKVSSPLPAKARTYRRNVG